MPALLLPVVSAAPVSPGAALSDKAAGVGGVAFHIAGLTEDGQIWPDGPSRNWLSACRNPVLKKALSCRTKRSSGPPADRWFWWAGLEQQRVNQGLK